MRRFVFALAALVAGACEPSTTVIPHAGQVILYVDTDALVPTGVTSSANPLDRSALFDRLRIEIYAPKQNTPCPDCTNEFSVDEAIFKRNGASVGIAPLAGAAGYRARVQLFYRPLIGVSGSEPDVTIERVVALPAVGKEGETAVTVFLATDEVGVPVGTLDAPVEPTPGAPTASRVGTWPGAQRTNCDGEAPAGKVCVPGGAFWMGDRRKLFAVLPEFDVHEARLVVVSPFFMDAHEVTVAELRADRLAVADNPRDDFDGSQGSDFCTFTRTATTRESLPVNCVRWLEARRYCQRHAGELATEAQWEYIASGMRSRSFVWGDDLPECADAVYSRLGWGAFEDSLATCKPNKPFGGPEAPGRGLRDRIALPTGEVLDLMGNVNEWALDVFNTSLESCWSRPGVYIDPVCTTAGARGPRQHTIKGGAWSLTAGQLDRTSRSFAPDTTTLLDTGFRCVAAP